MKLAEIEAKHIAHELAFSDAVSGKFVATYCNYKKDIWALGPRLRPNAEVEHLSKITKNASNNALL